MPLNLFLAEGFQIDIYEILPLDLTALLTQLVALGIMVFIVHKFFWKNVRELINKRKEIVVENLTKAEELNKEAEVKLSKAEEQLSMAYLQSNAIIDDAKIKAKNISDNIVNDALNEASNKKEQALREIEQERLLAKRQIKEEIIDVALLAAAKIVEKEVESKDNRRLVDQFVKEVDDTWKA